ncbi:hypothetical protein K3495_g13459 [Podosphaera aphanis]|nr:hypothetical protein K3495_g13459 [Podosphaera aphanis]
MQFSTVLSNTLYPQFLLILTDNTNLEELYDSEFYPAAHSNLQTHHYTLFAYNLNKTQGWSGLTLANHFAEDFQHFQHFQQEHFSLSKKETPTNFRKYLRQNGVYINMQRFLPIAKALADTIEYDPLWPENDLDIPNRPPLQSLPEPIKNSSEETSVESAQPPAIDKKPRNSVNATKSLQQKLDINLQPYMMVLCTLPTPYEMINKVFNNPKSYGHSRELMALTKMYCEENKYGGEPTESFAYNFNIFIDLGAKAELSLDSLTITFSTMSKGTALEYYYSSCQGIDLNIKELVKRFQDHFEGEDHRRNMLRKWNAINLRVMFRRNPDTEKGSMFNEIVQRLRAVQRGLEIEHQTDSALRNKIIAACSDVPARGPAIVHPMSSIAALCNTIYATIENN